MSAVASNPSTPGRASAVAEAFYLRGGISPNRLAVAFVQLTPSRRQAAHVLRG